MNTGSSSDAEGTGGFSAAWDDYVAQSKAEDGRWPGDEWGDAELWSAWFARLVEPYGVADWRFAVEVGQGSGKYTERVLAAGQVEVLCIDVSARFQSICARRLRRHVDSGRLQLRLIKENDPDALSRSVREAGWTAGIDAVYSIDTLVHLTVTQIASLILSATEVLRVGGLFIGTFADATSLKGIDKLVQDLDWVMRGHGNPSTACFHWSSPEVMRALAERFGFDVEVCDHDPQHHRDGHFVLRFARPDVAAACRTLRIRASHAIDGRST